VDDESLARWLDALFDFVCEQRLAAFVDVDRLIAGLDAAATEPRITAWLQRMGGPIRTRVLDRLRASKLPLSEWLPEPARDAIAQLLALPAPIPRALVDQVVADEHVRQNAHAMLLEELSSFIQKAFAATPGGRGLRGIVNLGARAAGGILGGLGDELQRSLEARTREFVDGRIVVIQQRIAQRLASKETAQMLGQRRRDLFLALGKRTEADVAKVAERVPWPALEALLPSVIAHNVAREPVRAALRDEVTALATELSKETIGELLDQAGLRELVRAGVRAHGLPLARAFVTSQAFAALPKP
jgi:hypothetical protein